MFDVDFADVKPTVLNALITTLMVVLTKHAAAFITTRYNLPSKDFWAAA